MQGDEALYVALRLYHGPLPARDDRHSRRVTAALKPRLVRIQLRRRYAVFAMMRQVHGLHIHRTRMDRRRDRKFRVIHNASLAERRGFEERKAA